MCVVCVGGGGRVTFEEIWRGWTEGVAVQSGLCEG